MEHTRMEKASDEYGKLKRSYRRRITAAAPRICRRGKVLSAFEMGVWRKTFEQIEGEEDGYLVVDGIETRARHWISSWMSELLY